MFEKLNRKMKGEGGFNMIELMVVVVIIGILAAIAVPIYSKYAKNARISEATGRMGDIVTAAKSYAVENTTGNFPTVWNWPDNCTVDNFIGNCDASANFNAYDMTGTDNGSLVITTTGKANTPVAGVTVTMTVATAGGVNAPLANGTVAVSGL